MAKIIAPNSEFNGESAGIKFTNGTGETDDANLISWFKEKGYKVKTAKDQKETDPKSDFPDNFPPHAKALFEKLNIGIERINTMTRDELIAVKGIAEKTADQIIEIRETE